MSNLTSLKALVGDAEFTAPLSPVEFIDTIVDYDEEGWPVWETFSVGERVVSTTGRLYKIIGFTKANGFIVTQSGLDIDPKIRFLEFAGGLRHEKPEVDATHKTGLVSMEWAE